MGKLVKVVEKKKIMANQKKTKGKSKETNGKSKKKGQIQEREKITGETPDVRYDKRIPG